MRISWNWLSTLMDTEGLTPRTVAEVLTSTGLEVEAVEEREPVKGMLRGVVVGHVIGCGKHPDADRLSLCTVDLGEGEPVEIVCGAPNVAEGQKVFVATVGAVLHLADGTELTIKRSRIRGVESNGMICAEDELGLGSGHEGIMVLPGTAVPGTPAADFLALKSDHVFEIGLTPNRSDAMGHFGVARDLVAALGFRKGDGRSVELPDVSAYAEGKEDPMKVTITAPEACRRYACVRLTEVKVGPSPAWLQDRLRSIGLSPVNNVVDVTNFVLHELGQPLHAFDADRIARNTIVVGHLTEGTPFTTLDGRQRTLAATDLMITDPNKPLCIAGVFGGQESGVTETTTAVVLESAWFDPVSIRRTARRHALNTDASFRFERGVDPELTLYALKRAALLLVEVAGATIASPITDVVTTAHTWKEVLLDLDRLNALCGVRIDRADVLRILELLGYRAVPSDGEKVIVHVPPYRMDVEREADLIEEVLRIYGFDRVPLPDRLNVPALPVPEVTPEGVAQRVAQHLSARGFREIMTPSLVNGGKALSLELAEEQDLVRILNPLSAELDVLRPTLLMGMLSAAAYNIARQQKDLHFFERGRTYVQQGGRTVESDTIGLLITGNDRNESWRGKAGRVHVEDLKGELELLLERLGLRAGTTLLAATHPGLEGAVELRYQQRCLAILGRVNRKVLKDFDLGQDVVFGEVREAALVALLEKRTIKFAEIPRYPAVRRDLSLLLNTQVTFAELRELAFRTERKLLRDVGLFDVYEGDKVPEGKKSYALSFILQDPDRTLTDEQVEKAMGRIRKRFHEEVGAELRG